MAIRGRVEPESQGYQQRYNADTVVRENEHYLAIALHTSNMHHLQLAKRATFPPQCRRLMPYRRHRSTARLDTPPPGAKEKTSRIPPLGRMPMTVLLRSLAFTTVMSTALLKPAMGFMRLMATHDARLFSPEKNPLVRMALRSSFYKQFAAGENEAEVGRTIRHIKGQGFTGVILGYAREIVIATRGRVPEPVDSPTEEELRDIEAWKQGTRRTLRMVGPGDFLAIK